MDMNSGQRVGQCEMLTVCVLASPSSFTHPFTLHEYTISQGIPGMPRSLNNRQQEQGNAANEPQSGQWNATGKFRSK
jgi:hypothetical protein